MFRRHKAVVGRGIKTVGEASAIGGAYGAFLGGMAGCVVGVDEELARTTKDRSKVDFLLDVVKTSTKMSAKGAALGAFVGSAPVSFPLAYGLFAGYQAYKARIPSKTVTIAEDDLIYYLTPGP